MQCKRCGWKRPLQEHSTFCDISVPLLKHRSAVDLLRVLHNFFSEEEIEGVECINCTLLTEREKRSAELSSLSNLTNNSTMECILKAYSTLRAEFEFLDLLIASAKSGGESASSQQLAFLGLTSIACTDYSRSCFVSRWPPVLSFHISRLSYDLIKQCPQKNRTRVTFPLSITSADLNTFSAFSMRSLHYYVLKCVLVHHGGAESGMTC